MFLGRKVCGIGKGRKARQQAGKRGEGLKK